MSGAMVLTRRMAAAAVALLLCAQPAAAQESGEPPCRILCVPDFKVEPTITFENLASRARVEVTDDAGGAVVERQARESVFELILALGIPTEIPRVGFTLETIFVPGARPTRIRSRARRRASSGAPASATTASSSSSS